MSERQLGVTKGFFDYRTFGFLKPLEDPTKTVFCHQDSLEEPVANGILVSYTVDTDAQHRPFATAVRPATVDDAAQHRMTGWVLDFDSYRNAGQLTDAGGNLWRFRDVDLVCDAIFEGQPVSFTPQRSERGAYFALLIDAVAAKENAA
jgi:cold shock CspA family protein